MSLLLALLLIVLYTIEGKTKIQWRRYGGGAKLPLCRRIHTFIVTDTIESRNCIHCMWFGEYIDVGSKYSSPG